MLMDTRWIERPEPPPCRSAVRNALWLIAGLAIALAIIFGGNALGLAPPEAGPM
jgi:hypothetical protein